jgi:signal transduction histidine kinase
MRIKSIEDLKQNINISTIVIFSVIFLSTLAILYLFHNDYEKKRIIHDNKELVSVGNLFKSNLSEKLSIIASSTIFLDYIRSGDESKKRLYPQFLLQMSTLKSRSISGMEIADQSSELIFSEGEVSQQYVKIKLCYLNETLDPEMGDCRFTWKLYFRPIELFSEMKAINSSVHTCQNCALFNMIDSDMFGSFPIMGSSGLKFNLEIPESADSLFNIYLVLLTLSLLIFGTWSWYRLSTLINTYIANPIKTLTTRLKANQPLDLKNNLDEIQYLIDEINIWKSKLSKMKADENAAKIAKIVAELAHDIRSPLAVISMIIKMLENVPEDERLILNSATQRISDIANGFLAQYKNPQITESAASFDIVHISGMLETILSEKRTQYLHKATITYTIADDAWSVFAYVNANDLKRVVSNLVNNAIEAYSETGLVEVSLKKSTTHLHIEIVDQGCGIPEHLLPKIKEGGVSVGKSDGNGLGLSHAISVIKNSEGSLDIQSTEGVGTTIIINLPLATATPEWFQAELEIDRGSIVCVLDDEHYAHKLWDLRFTQVNIHSSDIIHCTSSAELMKFHNEVDLLLIDYDLGKTGEDGLDIIRRHQLQNKAVLVTNRYDDVEVHQRCVQLGVRIVPKNYILNIPINISRSTFNSVSVNSSQFD